MKDKTQIFTPPYVLNQLNQQCCDCSDNKVNYARVNSSQVEFTGQNHKAMICNGPVTQDDGSIFLSVHSASVMIHNQKPQSTNLKTCSVLQIFIFLKSDLCAE